MARRPRRNHRSAFTGKAAISAIKGEKTLIELALEFDVHPDENKQWRDQLLEAATGVFGDPNGRSAPPQAVCRTRPCAVRRSPGRASSARPSKSLRPGD